MKIILASASKYRAQLLERINLKFEQIASKIDESKIKSALDEPIQIAQKLALLKAQKVFDQRPEDFIIASDQLAHLNGEILDKPENFENAFEQLSKMKAYEHELITAVCLLSKDVCIEFYDSTKLKMRNLSDKQIEEYLKFDEPYDCAGSYKLESRGISLFENINSNDFTAIEGLPLINLTTKLIELGLWK